MSSVSLLRVHRIAAVFAGGVICAGCGQELLSVGMIEPVLHDMNWMDSVALCGAVLLATGWGLLLWTLMMVLRSVHSRSRVVKLLLAAAGVVLLCAVCAGVAAQLLTGSGLVSYSMMKRMMWVCTAVVATVVKACVVAVLVVWLSDGTVSWRSRWLWYELLAVGGIVAAVACVSVIVPDVIADVALHVVDVVLLIGVVLVTRIKVGEQ